METPFSYKDKLFMPFVVSSLMLHLTALGVGSFSPSTAHFSVKQAPSSVELVILKEDPTPRFKSPAARVLTGDQKLDRSESVKQKREPVKTQSAVSSQSQGAVMEARSDFFENPAPLYPRIARERGWEGEVILKVLVDKSGNVEGIEIERSSGYVVLDQSAEHTVRGWKFNPARLGGLAFQSWIRIPIHFVLDDKEI